MNAPRDHRRFLKAAPAAGLLAAGFLLAATTAARPASAQDPTGDAALGALIWGGQCGMCHQVGPGADHGVGPHLNDIVGRTPGRADGFEGYSHRIIAMGDAGMSWDAKALTAFITDPYGFAEGTRMDFGGLHAPEDIGNLLAWLLPASTGQAVPPAPELAVSPEVLAIEGDVEWGEYLASECATCHLDSADAEGIPPITGWQANAFVLVMHAYRQKLRPNPVMQLVAGRLSDEEIAALAAYFAEAVEAD